MPGIDTQRPSIDSQRPSIDSQRPSIGVTRPSDEDRRMRVEGWAEGERVMESPETGRRRTLSEQTVRRVDLRRDISLTFLAGFQAQICQFYTHRDNHLLRPVLQPAQGIRLFHDVVCIRSRVNDIQRLSRCLFAPGFATARCACVFGHDPGSRERSAGDSGVSTSREAQGDGSARERK